MALDGALFLDSNVFIRGLVVPSGDSGPRDLLEHLAAQQHDDCHTAWHSCLEFYAVTTRLPVEYRLRPDHALILLETQIFDRFEVHGLHRASFLDSLRASVEEGLAGGRIYDAHIAAIARQAKARWFITENPRPFTPLERHGIAVRTAIQALAEL